MASPKLLMIIFIFTCTLLLSFSPPNSATSLVNCRDHCGNISIPFPFGTTPECYHNSSFFVTCNQTHYNPPKLFMQNSAIEITDISLEGQLRALQFVARDCYARNGTNIFRNAPWISLPPYLTFNNTANKFMTVGCDTVGIVAGLRRGRNYLTACTAQCEPSDETLLGPCNGLGCCQTSISEDVSRVLIGLRSSSNYSDIWEFNNCGYAFVVDQREFNFTRESLTSLKDVKRLPMVVDWAFGDGPCEEAQKNSTSYGCKSPNSECYRPGNSNVYRCRCGQGYQGNPYLVNGCQGVSGQEHSD